jgi:hypothetical protein
MFPIIGPEMAAALLCASNEAEEAEASMEMVEPRRRRQSSSDAMVAGQRRLPTSMSAASHWIRFKVFLCDCYRRVSNASRSRLRSRRQIPAGNE